MGSVWFVFGSAVAFFVALSSDRFFSFRVSAFIFSSPTLLAIVSAVDRFAFWFESSLVAFGFGFDSVRSGLGVGFFAGSFAAVFDESGLSVKVFSVKFFSLDFGASDLLSSLFFELWELFFGSSWLGGSTLFGFVTLSEGGFGESVFDESDFDESDFDVSVFDESLFDESVFNESVFGGTLFDESVFEESLFAIVGFSITVDFLSSDFSGFLASVVFVELSRFFLAFSADAVLFVVDFASTFFAVGTDSGAFFSVFFSEVDSLFSLIELLTSNFSVLFESDFSLVFGVSFFGVSTGAGVLFAFSLCFFSSGFTANFSVGFSVGVFGFSVGFSAVFQSGSSSGFFDFSPDSILRSTSSGWLFDFAGVGLFGFSTFFSSDFSEGVSSSVDP